MSEPVTRRRRFDALTAAVIALSAALWLVVGTMLVVGTQLRPLSDDYCLGYSGASLGWLGAIESSYMTWSGEIFQVAMAALLVGQPLAHLPFQVASLIPWALSALALVVATLAVLSVAAIGRGRSKWLAVVALAPLLAILWWSSWWLPVGAATSGHAWQMATTVTDWQVVNVPYVFVPGVLITAWIVLISIKPKRAWYAAVGFGFLGLITGLSGLVFAVSCLGFVVVFELAKWLATRSWKSTSLRHHLLFLASGVIGVAVAYLSPGTQARSALLIAGRAYGEHVTPWGIFRWVFPEGLYAWLGAVFTPTTLILVVVSIGIFPILAKLGVSLDRRRLFEIGAALATFALLLALAGRAGDGFAYPAFWHDVLGRTVLFPAAVALGLALGSLIWQLTSLTLVRVGVGAISGLVLLAGLGSLFVIHDHVSTREAAWEVGPAASAFGDIETDYVRSCWDRLGDYREIPDRG